MPRTLAHAIVHVVLHNTWLAKAMKPPMMDEHVEEKM
jgi:hypothetical protein